MQKFSLFQLIMLLSLLLLVQCSDTRKDHVRVHILQTTDVHGAIFPFDFIKQEPSENSLAQAHTYIKGLRDTARVVLLDNGDILQGQPTVYYSNFEDTQSEHICAKVMNYMQYDAATIGNHDIEAGHPVYDKVVGEFNFPWLAANAINTETGENYFRPYTVVEREGIKIAILGLITPGIPKWLPKKIYEGIEFQDMIETAQKWIPIIQKNEKPDLIIGLFHSGIDHTYNNESGESYLNENATLLVAKQVPGFDIVLAGHDHSLYNEWVVNTAGDSVLVLNPRSHARMLAHIVVDFDWDKNTKSYKKTFTAQIDNMQEFEADDEFMKKFDAEYQAVQEYVSRPIGQFSEAVSTRPALLGPSTFTQLINHIQLEISGADIAFSAPLSFDAQIDTGKIYVSDMFKLYRFENLLYTMELTGTEIKDYLEFTAEKWFGNSNEGTYLRFKRDNPKALYYSYYNFDAATGIDYTVDISKPAGQRVTINKMSNGNKFETSATYKVAINSYRGNGGGGHLTEGAGIDKSELEKRIITSTEKDLRYYMMKWIEENQQITPEKAGNWKVIPEKQVKELKKLDYEKLFGEKPEKDTDIGC